MICVTDIMLHICLSHICYIYDICNIYVWYIYVTYMSGYVTYMSGTYIAIYVKYMYKQHHTITDL